MKQPLFRRAPRPGPDPGLLGQVRALAVQDDPGCVLFRLSPLCERRRRPGLRLPAKRLLRPADQYRQVAVPSTRAAPAGKTGSTASSWR